MAAQGARASGDAPELVLLAVPNVLAIVLIALALLQSLYGMTAWDAAWTLLTVGSVACCVYQNVGEATTGRAFRRREQAAATAAAAAATAAAAAAPSPAACARDLAALPPATVAFLGLGVMGSRMAGVLSSHDSLTVRVWNRSAGAPAEQRRRYPLCISCESLEECVRGCEWVMCCLSRTSDVVEVARSVAAAAAARQGPLRGLVDFTSGEPERSRELAAELRARGLEYIDAPVSGGPTGAQLGTLTVMVGCDSAALFEQVRPLLQVVGRAVVHVGPVGSGHAVKAINNALNATALMMSMEGLVALAKRGVDPARALEAINASSGRNLQTQERIPKFVLSRKFDFGFALGLMAKDQGVAESVLDPSQRGGYISLTAALLREAVAKYGADVDFTNAARIMEDKVGVQLAAQPP